MSDNSTLENDPQELEILESKLEERRKELEYMENVNDYYLKCGTCKDFPDMPELTAAELDERVKNAYLWESQPFSSWVLSNNRVAINSLENRIEQITLRQQMAEQCTNASPKSKTAKKGGK